MTATEKPKRVRRSPPTEQQIAEALLNLRTMGDVVNTLLDIDGGSDAAEILRDKLTAALNKADSPTRPLPFGAQGG